MALDSENLQVSFSWVQAWGPAEDHEINRTLLSSTTRKRLIVSRHIFVFLRIPKGMHLDLFVNRLMEGTRNKERYLWETKEGEGGAVRAWKQKKKVEGKGWKRWNFLGSALTFVIRSIIPPLNWLIKDLHFLGRLQSRQKRKKKLKRTGEKSKQDQIDWITPKTKGPDTESLVCRIAIIF